MRRLQEVPSGNIKSERCYCWDIRQPFIHSLSDHLRTLKKRAR